MPAILKAIRYQLLAISFLLLTASYLLLATPPVYADNAAEPVTAANYNPNAHANFTIITLLGHVGGCLGEGTGLWGDNCLDMATKINNKGQAEGSIPYLFPKSASGGGALGALGGAMTAMATTAPIHPAEYIADVEQNIGIAKPALAQSVGGSGNAVISPILNLWKVTRNISYFGFIIIFMVIGFMIMFRQKINPQTVISAQNALPGVVIALILVTFSYFISALIIDFGFVATHLTGNILVANGLAAKNQVKDTLDNSNVMSLWNNFMGFDDAKTITDTTAQSLTFLNEGFVGNIVTTLAVGLSCKAGSGLAEGFVAPAVAAAAAGGAPLTGGASLFAIPFGSLGGSIAGCLIGGGLGYGAVQSGVIYSGIGVVLYVVLLIALIVAMFKVMFELIKAYITLMIQTIIAPFIFMVGAIPGQGGKFSGWFKTMAANVLIFPAVFMAFFFAAYILGKTGSPFGIDQASADAVRNSFDQNSTVPLLGGLTGRFIQMILGYGVLLMIPTIPAQIKAALKVQDSPFGGAVIGAAVGGFGIGKGFGERLASPWTSQREAFKKAKLEYDMQKKFKPGTTITP